MGSEMCIRDRCERAAVGRKTLERRDFAVYLRCTRCAERHGGYYRMRLIAILSPTDKWGIKTEYSRLRKFLLKDGYIRIGPEVFMRVVQNRKASEKHYRRIDEAKPKTGVVRLLRLTEKQYNNIYMVTGEPDYQEKKVSVNCHIMI